MLVFPQSISEARAIISKNRSRLSIVERELREIRRRDTNDRALKNRADGLAFYAPVREEHRYDWTRRYAAAMAAPEDSEEALQVCRSRTFFVR